MRRQTGMPAPSLRPVSRFLARLPSLPVAALHNPVGDERLDEALAVAGRGSHEAGARDRHRARMAFRPTPSGLFAGVAIGELGAKTEVASEGPRVAHLAVSWARCAALARALLDEPEVRERTRLRAAPSLLRDGERAIWLARGRGSPAARVERAAIDPLLDRVLVATQQWARWPSVRSAAAIDDLDEGSVDELLLVLLDDGLLVDDLTPPLVGAPPLRASIERLRRRRGAREREVAEALAAIAETLEGRGSPVIPRIREARARLDLLPGSGATDGEPLAATLELRPRRMTLARAAAAAPLPRLRSGARARHRPPPRRGAPRAPRPPRAGPLRPRAARARPLRRRSRRAAAVRAGRRAPVAAAARGRAAGRAAAVAAAAPGRAARRGRRRDRAPARRARRRAPRRPAAAADARAGADAVPRARGRAAGRGLAARPARPRGRDLGPLRPRARRSARRRLRRAARPRSRFARRRAPRRRRLRAEPLRRRRRHPSAAAAAHARALVVARTRRARPRGPRALRRCRARSRLGGRRARGARARHPRRRARGPAA